MSNPLLTTKLYVPPLRPELVTRPRLIERLNAGLGQGGPEGARRFARNLTLVSAPAGYGKTTLLSECAARCAEPGSDIHFAWLSLDERDNDPATFLVYLIAALQTIDASLGQAALGALQAPQPPATEVVLTTLINEIGQQPVAFVLVLDDYHLIEAQPIHDALGFLLEHLPPQMHLILSSRADPPLLLSRLRGRGQLSELRTDDLRFTASEAAAFLNQAMGLALSAEDVAALEARTEGWVVGLQMVALALQGPASMGGRDAGRVARFIAAFTGSHRYILDYLTDEVLSQQPEEIQRFLLQTAILDRLSGPLCDQVADWGSSSAGRTTSSQQVLERLDAANLFIVPLDDERRWYRYHHLFAGLLRSRLEQTQPGQVPILHLRASQWYEANHLLPEAISHAFAAGDVGRVATMLEGNALSLINYGRLRISLDWLSALPPEVVRSRPWLCIAYAWALVHTGAINEALACLDEFGPGEGASGDAGSSAHVTGHVNAIRFYVASVQPYAEEGADQYAHRALALLPEDDLRTRGLVAVILGMRQRMSLDFKAARETLSMALVQARSASEGYAVVDLLCQLARVEANQGELHQAVATCQEALQMAKKYGGSGGQQLPVVSYAHATIAGILCEWNRLHEAQHHAEAAIGLSRRWGQVGSLLNGYMVLLSVQVAQGDLPGAMKTVRRMRQLEPHVQERYALWIEDREVGARLALGEIAYAMQWAADRDFAFSDGTHWLHLMRDLTLVRIRIAQYNEGQVQALDDTLAYLVHTRARLEAVEAWRGTIELLVLQAMAWQAIGDLERSLAELSRALSLAEPEGYVRTFINEGEPMAALLRAAVARGVSPGYAANLLVAFRAEKEDRKYGAGPGSAASSPRPSAMIEALSQRELEVLRLLAAGLSNREIAAQLFLAVGTVKKYTSNIYGKLGVHSRTQAVARARELDLL